MTKISETGHAVNVANFENLLTTANALGATYNPSKSSLKIPALQDLLTASKGTLNTVNIAQSAYSIAVDAREVAFKPFNKLVTRVNFAVFASVSWLIKVKFQALLKLLGNIYQIIN